MDSPELKTLSTPNPYSPDVHFTTAAKMKYFGSRKYRLSVHGFLLLLAFSTGFSLLLLALGSLDPSGEVELPVGAAGEVELSADAAGEESIRLTPSSEWEANPLPGSQPPLQSSCATVEEMGEAFDAGFVEESLRVRRIFRDHFALHGAARVRELPPDQFCRHGFVLGKASEAGFGNEMYKILTAAALSALLNRSLIIGQTRGKYPFGDYISYTNQSFTLKEVKHLWRRNDCVGKYGRHLIMRTDNFERPTESNVLCSDWRKWKQPIIWFQGTTDAVAVQFFLKNVHPRMKDAASVLFGQPRFLQSRPNVFGELMRFVVSPSQAVEEAVNWVLSGGPDPVLTLHMRMMMNRSVRAVRAALNCIKKALHGYHGRVSKPRVVLVSDTPSLIRDITPNLTEFAEVLHFDYKLFKGNISGSNMSGTQHTLDFRVKDWGPAPRWVMFVDFFLASRAKHAVVSGAHRRVGTTYAQLIAALAAANQLDEYSSTGSKFSFFSSFQSNLLVDGLRSQVGWGHIWNRYAGPLSCRSQSNQCAFTPLLPSAWWDTTWQSPILRDIRRLQAFGVQLTDSGEIIENQLQSFCKYRRDVVKTAYVYRQ